MKKRVVSFILALVLSFSCVSFAAEKKEKLTGMDYIAKRLTIFTHEDRRNLEIIFIPLLITDTGLDTLVKTVNEYTPESEAFMHQLLTKFLVRVDKEELLGAISYLYMIDEEDREEYIGGFYERKALALPAGAQKAMDNLMNRMFLKYPDLKEVFEEDGITAGVMARMFKMFSSANDDTPLFKVSLKNELEINSISYSLRNKIDSVILKEKLPYKNAGELLDAVAASLNESYAGEYMQSFIEVGRQTNLVLALNNSADGFGGGETGIEANKVTVSLSADKNTVTVSATDKDGKQIIGICDLFPVSFNLEEKGYLVDEDGKKVKFMVIKDGVWYALLNKPGTYTIKKSDASYFDDVSGWGKEYIDALYERNIISGRGERVFSPYDNITREEFVKLIVELFSLKGDFGNPFTDVTEDKWYYEYVSAAKHYKIVDGYTDGTFGAGRNITRQDMCKILYSVMEKAGIKVPQSSGITLEFADSRDIAGYAYPSVMALKKAKIVSGDDKGRFNPNNFATRQEASKLIYMILENYVVYYEN